MKKPNRLPLILILLIGIMAPLASTLLFYFAPPQNNTAAGELLNATAAPKQWNLDDGKWTLLYASDNTCGTACQQRLCQMRQLRLMLPGSYFRLRRAWLTSENTTDNIQDLTATNDCGETRAAAFSEDAKEVNIGEGVIKIIGDLNTLPAPRDKLSREDYLYLTDPDGFLIMRFPPEVDAYSIRGDLKKLLKISKGRRDIKINQ
ncbi:MAG: hypothetical protein ACNYPH_02000 [Gammaproteobacteria bacterium WSBS_2016_MAG_OTU1]